MPNRLTITASASSTHRIARIIPIQAVCPSMNSALVCALAFGKARSACVASWSANVSRLRSCSKVASKAACETVIGPRPSTSSTGDFSMPDTVRSSVLPLSDVIESVLPTFRPCSVAKPSSIRAPSAVSEPAVKS